MKIRLTRKQFEQSPGTGFIVGGSDGDITYEVSDDFIRDFNIELNFGHQTNYTTMLIKLIFKAHGDNWNKLSTIYPAECLTMWAYQNITDFYLQLSKE